MGEELIGRLKSQDAVESYAFDACNLQENRTIWKIHMTEDTHFLCDAWSTMLNPHESVEQQLHFVLRSKKEEEEKKAARPGKGRGQNDLQAKASIRPNNNLWNDYDNFNLREKVYENCYSKKIVVFVRHAIVNKTDVPITFGLKGKFGILLEPHSCCLFNIAAGTKLAFKACGFSKSPRPEISRRLVQRDAGHDRRSHGRVQLTAKAWFQASGPRKHLLARRNSRNFAVAMRNDRPWNSA